MYLSIRHFTIFNYTAPVSQSIMEVRKQPRSDGTQRCLSFKLLVNPQAAVQAYRDYHGNVVHHFDVPAPHDSLTLTAESFVEMLPAPPVPDALDPAAWDALDAAVREGDFYDALLPGTFAQETPLLLALADELDARRRADPLTLLRDLNGALFQAFEYQPNSTNVDSPIDDALRSRQGVCQDYAHIFLALVRRLGIPARYVSGYLARYDDDRVRSAPDASHAWVEAYLPALGWVGFDPTNNRLADMHHVRVAVGSDYADVPPTRGVYKGSAVNELKVAVQVRKTDTPPPADELLPATGWMVYGASGAPMTSAERYAQQQQQ